MPVAAVAAATAAICSISSFGLFSFIPWLWRVNKTPWNHLFVSWLPFIHPTNPIVARFIYPIHLLETLLQDFRCSFECVHQHPEFPFPNWFFLFLMFVHGQISLLLWIYQTFISHIFVPVWSWNPFPRLGILFWMCSS